MARTNDPNLADDNRERTGNGPDRIVTAIPKRDHLRNQHPLSPTLTGADQGHGVKPGEASAPAGSALPNLPSLTMEDYAVIGILLALAAAGFWLMLYLCDYVLQAYPK